MIATGQEYSLRAFIKAAVDNLGVQINFEGEKKQEIGIIASVADPSAYSAKSGDAIIKVDPKYYRPTEVKILLGDPTKAKEKLGWEPTTNFEVLV